MPVLLAISHFHLNILDVTNSIKIPPKFHQNSIRSSRNRHEQSMFNRCLHLRTWSKMQNVYNFRIVSPAMLARELNVLPEPSGLEGHVGCRWLIEEGWSWPGRGCYLMATSARQIGDTISFLQRPHSNLTKKSCWESGTIPPKSVIAFYVQLLK